MEDSIPSSRVCTKCGAEKPLDSYRVDPRRKGGRIGASIACASMTGSGLNPLSVFSKSERASVGTGRKKAVAPVRGRGGLRTVSASTN